MTTDDTAPTPSGEQRDGNSAPGGASCRVRRSYGPSYALAPAQGGGGDPVGPRAGAHGVPAGDRHQGAQVAGGPADDRAPREQPSTPAFPDRAPRRRSRNRSRRIHKLTTRLSLAETNEITAAARHRAVTVARFVASAALTAARDDLPVHGNEQLDTAIDELAALRTAVSRVGNNINQIAYVCNSGGLPHPGELDHALTALARTLTRVDDTADALVRKRI